MRKTPGPAGLIASIRRCSERFWPKRRARLHDDGEQSRPRPQRNSRRSLAEISNAVNSNPAVQEALAATAACLTSAGYDPQAPPPPAVASSCNQGQSVINSVRESVELAVMNEHYDFFVAFKAHLPDV